MKFWKLQAL
ncbi:hypothetical protein F383_30445 [Gossypium arboreum]|uniref:Uncharacterized protein n=1 Tax=Gossypium arboreum TaxID=29729 RepID=A0A0B0PIS3_GOSAR|nr:hypothetical protein F383_30445 [Gossypium arboreum]